jgi:hypothetical protein
MSDWLDDFEMFGAKLNEGEKALMRFAMRKKQNEIIKLLDTDFWHHRVWDPENPHCVKDCPMCELLDNLRSSAV